MEIKPKTTTDHAAVLKEIEGLMGAELGTPEGDRLGALATLAQAYEAKHFPLELPNPTTASKS